MSFRNSNIPRALKLSIRTGLGLLCSFHFAPGAWAGGAYPFRHPITVYHRYSCADFAAPAFDSRTGNPIPAARSGQSNAVNNHEILAIFDGGADITQWEFSTKKAHLLLLEDRTRKVVARVPFENDAKARIGLAVLKRGGISVIAPAAIRQIREVPIFGTNQKGKVRSPIQTKISCQRLWAILNSKVAPQHLGDYQIIFSTLPDDIRFRSEKGQVTEITARKFGHSPKGFIHKPVATHHRSGLSNYFGTTMKDFWVDFARNEEGMGATRPDDMSISERLAKEFNNPELVYSFGTGKTVGRSAVTTGEGALH